MANDPTTHPHRGPDITPAETFAARRDSVLLDVREPAEWSVGHAADARHLPLGDLDARALDIGVPIITICRSGNRSGKAADTLAAAGFTVRNMCGGMNAWQEQGLPVVREDGSPGTIG